MAVTQTPVTALARRFENTKFQQALRGSACRHALGCGSAASRENSKVTSRTSAYTAILTSSPPSVDDCRLRGKGGDPYGAQAKAA